MFSFVPLDHLFANYACHSDKYSPCSKIAGHDKTAKLNCVFNEYSDQLCLSPLKYADWDLNLKAVSEDT